MAIDHSCLVVAKDKFKECLDIYLAALKPLGYEQRHQYGETVVGLGSTLDPVIADYSRSDFWVTGVDSSSGSVVFPVHVAFTATGKSWASLVLARRPRRHHGSSGDSVADPWPSNRPKDGR